MSRNPALVPAKPRRMPLALTIAGSDSGGGAGIQADLKTFSALGVFGASAITCLTAQNPDAVIGIEPVSPAFIELQVRAVCEGFTVAAAKTGMLYSAGIIRAVAGAVRRLRIRRLVVDPVMIATSGARLLRADAVRALMRDLLPLAEVVTPNLPEAEVLCGHAIRARRDLGTAAREISEQCGCACALKGGHLAGRAAVDVLWAGGGLHEFELPRVRIRETHGTGCTFSAALAAHLALGRALPEAVRRAKAYVQSALGRAPAVGRHRPLGF
ncbi:MAG: bifunctional hydroxymethylpyrimidine kinase/phosphomethylpyrimidine kinase [Lentisphaerae bacterium]|nr:bifunctional hydroxymethylpyrimidine kinase/phosphomethylpyrimidine kinase [Lentisphaerota bacterium]